MEGLNLWKSYKSFTVITLASVFMRVVGVCVLLCVHVCWGARGGLGASSLIVFHLIF